MKTDKQAAAESNGLNININMNVDVNNIALTEVELQRIKDFVGSGAIKTPYRSYFVGIPTAVSIAEATDKIMSDNESINKAEIILGVENKVVDSVPTEVFYLGYYLDASSDDSYAQHVAIELEKKKSKIAEYLKMQKDIFG